MASRELVQAMRDMALNTPYSVHLRLDDPQAWPAILTYADTIEADNPAISLSRSNSISDDGGIVFPPNRFSF